MIRIRAGYLLVYGWRRYLEVGIMQFVEAFHSTVTSSFLRRGSSGWIEA